MPTYYFKIPQEKKVGKKSKRKKERYVTGPSGEKRPMSVTSNAVRVMQIATGITEEEYVDRKTKN